MLLWCETFGKDWFLKKAKLFEQKFQFSRMKLCPFWAIEKTKNDILNPPDTEFHNSKLLYV